MMDQTNASSISNYNAETLTKPTDFLLSSFATGAINTINDV